MNMQWLQNKVLEGPNVDWSQYGNVRAVYNGDLVLFNYTAKAQYSGDWNWIERVSRGLILNWKTGEIVARGFDKFHNWLESGRKSSGHIVAITEKMDGSLGILIRQDGKYRIATRGSFESDQALWATEFLQDNYSLSGLPNEYTLLFEIVYPENRIVIDYGDTEALYLLAIRNRFTGEYLPFYPDVYEIAEKYGFPTPKVYNFNSVTDILEVTEKLPASEEGFVVEFSDGQRFKFKGDRYLELHRLVTKLTFNRVLEAVKLGLYDTLLWDIPDEFHDQIKEWRQQIDYTVKTTIAAVETAWNFAPKMDRKTFALWCQKNAASYQHYLYAKMDGRDYVPMILDCEF